MFSIKEFKYIAHPNQVGVDNSKQISVDYFEVFTNLVQTD